METLGFPRANEERSDRRERITWKKKRKGRGAVERFNETWKERERERGEMSSNGERGKAADEGAEEVEERGDIAPEAR